MSLALATVSDLPCLIECHFDGRLPHSPIYSMEFLLARPCRSDVCHLSSILFIIVCYNQE